MNHQVHNKLVNFIWSITDELGFTDESHLSRQFKKHTGISPTTFRQQNSN